MEKTLLLEEQKLDVSSVSHELKYKSDASYNLNKFIPEKANFIFQTGKTQATPAGKSPR